METEEARFMTITEVSRLTGYCVSYLRELVARGVVKPERTSGGVRLFTYKDVGDLKARKDQLLIRRKG